MSLLPKRRRSDVLPMAWFGREMAGLFDDFFRSVPDFAEEFGFSESFPALDVKEADDALEVTAEVPGMTAGDLDISVVGDILTIRGEKREEKENKSKSVHRIERRYGRFERRVTLPVEVDVNKTEASYKDGVLSVKLRKKEETRAKTRRIEVRQE